MLAHRIKRPERKRHGKRPAHSAYKHIQDNLLLRLPKRIGQHGASYGAQNQRSKKGYPPKSVGPPHSHLLAVLFGKQPRVPVKQPHYPTVEAVAQKGSKQYYAGHHPQRGK